MTITKICIAALVAATTIPTPAIALEGAAETYEDSVRYLVEDLAEVCNTQGVQGRLAVLPFHVAGSRRDSAFSLRLMKDVEHGLKKHGCFDVVARTHAQQAHKLLRDNPPSKAPVDVRKTSGLMNINGSDSEPKTGASSPFSEVMAAPNDDSGGGACGGDGRPHCLFDLVDWIVFGVLQRSGETVSIWADIAPTRSLVVSSTSRRTVQARGDHLAEWNKPLDIFPRETGLYASGLWKGVWTCGKRYEAALDLVERPSGEIFARLTLEGGGSDGLRRSAAVLQGQRRAGDAIELDHVIWTEPGPEGWTPLDARLRHRRGESVMNGRFPPTPEKCSVELARSE